MFGAATVTPSALPREAVERSAKALSWRTPTALARLCHLTLTQHLFRPGSPKNSRAFQCNSVRYEWVVLVMTGL
jgi:hypothetical protein